MLAHRIARWLRDEEADASKEGTVGESPIELSRPLSGDAAQQEVQQQGRATARMRDRRRCWLPAKFARAWHAPIVRIEVVRGLKRVGVKLSQGQWIAYTGPTPEGSTGGRATNARGVPPAGAKAIEPAVPAYSSTYHRPVSCAVLCVSRLRPSGIAVSQTRAEPGSYPLLQPTP
jgi:hypothetical protein